MGVEEDAPGEEPRGRGPFTEPLESVEAVDEVGVQFAQRPPTLRRVAPRGRARWVPVLERGHGGRDVLVPEDALGDLHDGRVGPHAGAEIDVLVVLDGARVDGKICPRLAHGCCHVVGERRAGDFGVVVVVVTDRGGELEAGVRAGRKRWRDPLKREFAIALKRAVAEEAVAKLELVLRAMESKVEAPDALDVVVGSLEDDGRLRLAPNERDDEVIRVRGVGGPLHGPALAPVEEVDVRGGGDVDVYRVGSGGADEVPLEVVVAHLYLHREDHFGAPECVSHRGRAVVPTRVGVHASRRQEEGLLALEDGLGVAQGYRRGGGVAHSVNAGAR